MEQELKIGDKIYTKYYSYDSKPSLVVKVGKKFVFTDNGLKFRRLTSDSGYCYKMENTHSARSYWLESDEIIKQIEDNRK
tara:strand:- start:32 stop:271 length:240 start_codon:yes stop_codon:yes gene_type:complete